MTTTVRSADGTRIAYDRLGRGDAVVLVGGMFCTRQATRPLAEQLATRFTVANVDRRGRGESGDTPPYQVEREVEDLAAVVEDVGGKAALYGHSSGAALALRAAAAGVPVTRLVLHEPPYSSDDEESRSEARALAADIEAALCEGRRADAIRVFLASSGAPHDVVEAMSTDPAMLAVAPTMRYDVAVMDEASSGGAIPTDAVAAVDVPTLVLAGGASPDFFRDAAVRLVELLADGTYAVLDGQDHGASAEVVAPAVASFLSR